MSCGQRAGRPPKTPAAMRTLTWTVAITSPTACRTRWTGCDSARAGSGSPAGGGYPSAVNLRPAADWPDRAVVTAGLARVQAVIDRIAADVDELARARRAGGPGHRGGATRPAGGAPPTAGRAGPGVPGLLRPQGIARLINPAAGAGLGRMAGRAIPSRRDRPAAGLHRQPVPATLTTRPPCPAFRKLDAVAVLTTRLLPAPHRRR